MTASARYRGTGSVVPFPRAGGFARPVSAGTIVDLAGDLHPLEEDAGTELFDEPTPKAIFTYVTKAGEGDLLVRDGGSIHARLGAASDSALAASFSSVMGFSVAVPAAALPASDFAARVTERLERIENAIEALSVPPSMEDAASLPVRLGYAPFITLSERELVEQLGEDFSSSDWADIFDSVADSESSPWPRISQLAARAVHSQSPLVRAAAGRTLAVFDYPNAVSELRVAIEREMNPAVRQILSGALRSALLK